MLTKLLKNHGKVVTDQQLDELNKKILANMSQPKEFFHPDVLLTSDYFLFDKFYELAIVFEGRMKKVRCSVFR